jgi:hypothetical protein
MREPETTQSNLVRAVFQDTTMLAFDSGRDTTLGQLAEKISNLARFHGGLFLPVHVRLAPSGCITPGR